MMKQHWLFGFLLGEKKVVQWHIKKYMDARLNEGQNLIEKI